VLRPLPFALLLLATVAAAQSAPPTVRRHTLANGMQVVMEPFPEFGRVAVAVAYQVGRRDQPAGRRGLAHLTEHLMYEGSPNAGTDGFFRYAERVGATNYNATTGDDFTTYFVLVPRHQLETILWLESDRMAYLLNYLEERHVAVQQRVVLAEQDLRLQADPLGSARQRLFSFLYPEGHPYRDTLERREDVEAIELWEVQSFFQQHYGPDRATIGLAGGFDPDEALALVERYFGPVVRSAPAPARPAPFLTEPPRGGADLVLYDPQLYDALYYFWRTPRYGELEDGALDLWAFELGQSGASRLTGALVDRGLALTASAAQVSQELASLFTISARPVPGGDVGPMRPVIEGVLRELPDRPLEGELLERARRRYLEYVPPSAEDLLNRASSLATMSMMAGRRPDEHPRAYDIRRYGAIDPPLLADTARRWLDPANAVVLEVRQDRSAPPEGRVVVR
jgi:zinc protease